MTKTLLLLSAILLVGCTTITAESVEAQAESRVEMELLYSGPGYNRIYTFEDTPGVKCWVTLDKSLNTSGISCLPIPK